MTVYIVEDDLSVADSLKLVVETMGHPAVAYERAEELLSAGRPVSGDTLIVDLGLPGIGGVDVIRWALDLDDPPHVVAITGQPINAITRLMDGIDVPTLLRKPLSHDLIAAVLPML